MPPVRARAPEFAVPGVRVVRTIAGLTGCQALGGACLSPSPSFRGGLQAYIILHLQDIVEAVEGAAERDTPGQLDDLRLAEAGAQAREDLVAGPAPVAGDRYRVLDHQPVGL